MRCPDCSKFVSFNEPEAEVTGEEVRIVTVDPPTLSINAEVRCMLACAECGNELKEANLTVEEEFTEADGEPLVILDGDEVEIVNVETDPLDEGGGRYAKRYYGATIKFTVERSKGVSWPEAEHGEKVSFDLEVEAKEAASYFEELV